MRNDVFSVFLCSLALGIGVGLLTTKVRPTPVDGEQEKDLATRKDIRREIGITVRQANRARAMLTELEDEGEGIYE